MKRNVHEYVYSSTPIVHLKFKINAFIENLV
jgi:hypothetical protein